MWIKTHQTWDLNTHHLNVTSCDSMGCTGVEMGKKKQWDFT